MSGPPLARPRHPWGVRAVAWAVVAVSVAVIGRSAWQACTFAGSIDFATVYAASRAWAAGGNPYDMAALRQRWDAAGGTSDVTPDPYATPSVYPPTTLLVVAPLASTARWQSARVVWAAINLTALLAVPVALAYLAGLPPLALRTLALAAVSLTMVAVRQSLSGGQPVVIAMAAVVFATVAARRRWDVAAGLLLGIAVAVKVPVGGPFAAYWLLRRRWRTVGIAAAAVAVLTAVAVGRLQASGTPWASTLAANVARSTAVGGINDPSRHNPQRAQLLDLPALVHLFTDDHRWAVAVTTVVTVGLAVPFAAVVWRRPATGDALPAREMAELAFVAAWLLLPVYHRWYDAGPLVFAAAWALAAVQDRRWAVPATVALAAFVPLVFVPVLRVMWFSDPVVESAWRPRFWVQRVLVPIDGWTVCLLAAVTLWVLCRHRLSGPTTARPAE